MLSPVTGAWFTALVPLSHRAIERNSSPGLDANDGAEGNLYRRVPAQLPSELASAAGREIQKAFDGAFVRGPLQLQ